MMIGTELCDRSCLHTSRPSSFGSMMSSTTRSTGWSPNRASASSPSAAWATWSPSRSRGKVNTFRTVSSSSTRSIVELSAIGSGLPRASADGSASYYSPEMAATLPPVRRRRRPRRGSLERPVSSQLYRSAFLVCSLPLLLAAFSVVRPGALQKPLLPPEFDARSTLELTRELATEYPDRSPGSAGSLAAARWFRMKLAPYGLATSTDTWTDTLAGGEQVRLHNVSAIARGDSPDTIVVMAHRDNTGAGPGADDNATGTASLIELARAYARPQTEAQAAVASAHTLVFLSTDAGASGELGAVRFATHSPLRSHVVAVVNLDALGGTGPPRIVITGG